MPHSAADVADREVHHLQSGSHVGLYEALQYVLPTVYGDGKPRVWIDSPLPFITSVAGYFGIVAPGMQVVWCPHPELLNEYAGREELVLAGLMGEHKEVPDEEALGVATQGGEVQKGKAPGEVGDGWAVLLKSLEGFPYERFGIEA